MKFFGIVTLLWWISAFFHCFIVRNYLYKNFVKLECIQWSLISLYSFVTVTEARRRRTFFDPLIAVRAFSEEENCKHLKFYSAIDNCFRPPEIKHFFTSPCLEFSKHGILEALFSRHVAQKCLCHMGLEGLGSPPKLVFLFAKTASGDSISSEQ
jgi:hypothetical protein